MAKRKSNITRAMSEYLKYEADVDKKIAALDWADTRSLDQKFRLLEELNKRYEKVPKEERNLYHYGTRHSPVFDGRAAAEAVGRSRFYRKQVEKGVYGRDLIQPYLEDGKPNPDFADHYGVKEYPKEVREELK